MVLWPIRRPLMATARSCFAQALQASSKRTYYSLKRMNPIKVNKPSAVIFALDTATKSFFKEEVLLPYIKKNSNAYLAANWENPAIHRDVQLLREAAKKYKSSVKIADASADADTIQRSVFNYVSNAMDRMENNEAVSKFCNRMILDGYANGYIETPVHSDVAKQLPKWALDEKIKIFVFSDEWKQTTKRYLQKTNHGDLNLFIEDHFDRSDGPLTDPATFKKVVGKMKQAPEDVLFLAHSGKEGYAAKQAGLSVILIVSHRRDVAKMPEQEKKDFKFVHSFDRIIFRRDAPSKSNKGSSKKSSKKSAVSTKSKKVSSKKSVTKKPAKSAKTSSPSATSPSGKSPFRKDSTSNTKTKLFVLSKEPEAKETDHSED